MTNLIPKLTEALSILYTERGSGCIVEKREFNERFFVGAGLARPNKKPGYGATHHSPQTAIIELPFVQNAEVLKLKTALSPLLLDLGLQGAGNAQVSRLIEALELALKVGGNRGIVYH